MDKGYIICIKTYNTFSYLGITNIFDDEDFDILSNDPKTIIDNAVFLDEIAFDDDDIKCIVFKTADDAVNFIMHYHKIYEALSIPMCMMHEIPHIDCMQYMHVSEFPYNKRNLLKLK